MKSGGRGSVWATLKIKRAIKYRSREAEYKFAFFE